MYWPAFQVGGRGAEGEAEERRNVKRAIVGVRIVLDVRVAERVGC